MSDTSDPNSAPDAEAAHPFIVGLGASAGGIKALQEFFSHVQPAANTAYVVILHLSPSHESRLAAVLQSIAPMPVSQVTTDTLVEPDHVYVIPPNKTLELVNDRLLLSDVVRIEQRRAPVDVFFRALAEAEGPRAVAVVLSGTGPNGSAGVKRIKEYGGLAIAQDPAEAEYGDMPRNAIATGLVDIVLPVAAIPGRIAAHHARLRQGAGADGNGIAVAAADDLREILTVLRLRTGHDFSNYKPGTLERRIERRALLHNLPSASAYARLLREDAREASALMKELLISVTNFFRDVAAFEALAVRAIPRMFADRGADDQVRAWVAGCATGEEAYSVAMLIAEHAATLPEPPAVQVFATDLDERAIAVAREGYYADADVVDVSEERLARFFRHEAGGYRVRRELRELVLFAHHNLISDPPFSHLDLISCRNLLIYLNRVVQQRVIDTFHFALRPGGFLLLGTAETPDASQDGFVRADKSVSLYEHRGMATHAPGALPASAFAGARPPVRPAGPQVERLIAGDLHHRLLEEYAPPSILVSEDYNVLHLSEHAGRYLQVAGGEPNRDLFRMARPELRADLRSALGQAARDRKNVDVRGIRVSIDGAVREVTVEVRPVLRPGDPARGFFLVMFSEAEAAVAPGAVELSSPAEPLSVQLEEELSRVKTQLRTTVEQYETQVEEAKASNEELQAANEELRSAAEELETSKEELQSLNEELTTLNQELKIKIDELGETNDNLQNLINSTDIATIFLDRDLRVRMSTPSAREIFNLQRSDAGRPLSDITTHVRYDNLYDDVRWVLQHLQTIDREVQARNGRWQLARLRPYRTMDDRIDGVVLTFQDITGRREAELQVRRSEERLRLLIDSVIDYALFTMSDDGLIDSWNAGAERMFGYTADDILGRSVDILFTPEDRRAGVPAAERDRARADGRASDERRQVRKDGTVFHCTGVTTALGDRGGLGFARVARDLSASRLAADALRDAVAQTDARVRQRTTELEAEVVKRLTAQTDLENLLRKIVTAQEDERARIARDLHDQLGQQLTALRLTLEQHLQRLAAEGGPAHDVERALALAREIDREVDFLAGELRPAMLDDLGLAAALPRYLQQWSGHYGIRGEFRGASFTAGDLPRDAELVFYRVAQEALNNILKHAHASRVDVMLETRDGRVVLIVEDDGLGFDLDALRANAGGIGLAGMRERAASVGATLQIESGPGEGTSIYLRCPAAAAAG